MFSSLSVPCLLRPQSLLKSILLSLTFLTDKRCVRITARFYSIKEGKTFSEYSTDGAGVKSLGPVWPVRTIHAHYYQTVKVFISIATDPESQVVENRHDETIKNSRYVCVPTLLHNSVALYRKEKLNPYRFEQSTEPPPIPCYHN